jgi:quercetin dioxygenase-like cupin family protein
MHLTQTIDFIVIIEGKVRLILDNDERLLGPGDVVVQRGTNHAWVCESEAPAMFVAILIEKDLAR